MILLLVFIISAIFLIPIGYCVGSESKRIELYDEIEQKFLHDQRSNIKYYKKRLKDFDNRKGKR
jgi:hypothetical protein